MVGPLNTSTSTETSTSTSGMQFDHEKLDVYRVSIMREEIPAIEYEHEYE